MHFFMKHLSIADLVVAIFQVLPQLIWDITFRFYGPDFLCRLVKYLQVVGMFASTYLLVLMSVDRCLAVCQPLRSLQRRKGCEYVFGSWLLSLLLSLPQTYIFSLKEVAQGVYDCWGDFVQPWGAKVYITWISLAIYIIPVTILSICYGLTSFKIWQNFKLKSRRDQPLRLSREMADGAALSRVSSVRLISEAKIRTVKMTFIVVLAYVICWTPFFFVQMWSAWDPMAPREGQVAMDRSCSVNRRQAWAQCSRHWLTVEETEPDVSASSNTQATPAGQLSLKDEVVPDGCSTIETWLQSCGNEASQVNPSQHTLESLLRTADSFEDDLSLGAEATGPNGGLHDIEFGHCPLLQPPPKSRRKDLHTSSPQEKLNLPLRNMGQSMASSIFSSTTNKTASSVSAVLQMCAEDAEETLYQLGFGCEEPQVTARIPARFFTFPSQLRGINFRLFLESQLRRIREEDPNLSIASRFRQVEVLTAMANAFYSLYSHVSRTPVQKLAPPEFSFSSPTVERSIGQRFFGNVRSEPRSPVERLKDTVSKMCLYTRGSDSTSPNCSPHKRNSLPDVVEIIAGNVRGKGNQEQSRELWIRDGNITHKVKDENSLLHAEKLSNTEKTTSVHKQRIQRWSQPEQREDPRAKSFLFKWDHASLESIHNQNLQDTDLDKDSSNSTSLPDSSENPAYSSSPAPTITFDTISPHVVEHVHKAPYRCLNMVQAMGFSMSGPLHRPESGPRTLEHKLNITDTNPSPVQNQGELMAEVTSKVLQSDPVSLHTSITQGSPCQILVTGWEEDQPVLHRNLFEEYIMCPCSTERVHSSNSDQKRFLSPSNDLTSQINCQLKQANSFELEEVQSVGEEENTSVEQSSSYSLPVKASVHQKCLPLRGDSFQSDSSGYAEEDMPNLHTYTNRD